MDELSIAVVGIGYLNADGSDRRFEIKLLRRGDELALRPEPKNKADPRAIQVMSPNGICIGYVTAERCGLIGARLQRDTACILFQEEQAHCVIARVRFGGGRPSLPAPRPARITSNDGFFPDDDGPEWGA